MSVSINSGQLRLEMALRGWDAVDLARASRLSAATVSIALAGKPASAWCLDSVVDYVMEVVGGLRLVRRDEGGAGAAQNPLHCGFRNRIHGVLVVRR
jgi:hypothetical protein